MKDPPNTPIPVWPRRKWTGSFVHIQHTTVMTTIGKRYLQRTKHPEEQGRILDSRTRAVLSAVLQAGRGRTLDAYLRATKGRTER